MSRETEFLDRWRKESPAYSAWGKFVAQKLTETLTGVVSPLALEVFLKMPVRPRVKGDDSFLQKAFHRNKNYRDPYDEIEDKVGLVVFWRTILLR
jgi:putative GTP pyrophosphokinase